MKDESFAAAITDWRNIDNHITVFRQLGSVLSEAERARGIIDNLERRRDQLEIDVSTLGVEKQSLLEQINAARAELSTVVAEVQNAAAEEQRLAREKLQGIMSETEAESKRLRDKRVEVAAEIAALSEDTKAAALRLRTVRGHLTKLAAKIA